MLNQNIKLIVLFLSILLISCGTNTPKNNDVAIDKEDYFTPEIAEITNKINSDPNNVELYVQRAVAFLDFKKTEEALLDINKALSFDSTKADYYIIRSDVYFAMGSGTKSKESLLKAIKLEPENVEALLKIAELHFYFKEYENTFKYLEKVAAIDKYNATVWFMRGMAFKDMGDTARAVKSFMETVQIDQSHYDAYLYLGILHAARKSLLAVDFYNNALNIKPNSAEVLYNLGLFYQETENYDKAIQTYTMVTTQDIKPDNPQFMFLKHSYYNLGYVNLQFTQLYRQAVKYFTFALNLDPVFVEAYYNRGYSYELMGDVINARKDYEKALQLKTNYDLAVKGLNRLDYAVK